MNTLPFNPDQIRDLARRYGTPFYLYDAARLRENCRRTIDAFAQHYPATHIHYAIKANPNPHLVSIIAAEGIGADCSSPLEVTIAERCGIPRERIMYTGNYESREDLAAAVRCGAINLDDISALDRLPEGYDGILSFRVNPGEGCGTHPGIVTGGPDAKFGITLEQAPAAYRLAVERGFRSMGIHLMAGSNNRDPLFFAHMTAILADTARRVMGPLGIEPAYLDIGGGFGIPYADHEEVLDIQQTARLIGTHLFRLAERDRLPLPHLRLEPGRYLVGDAGYLVSTVTAVKEGPRRFVGLDAGMNTLIRPALYGAQHRVHTAGNDHDRYSPATLCGRICENTDLFAVDIPLPPLTEGDPVIFRDCGAYAAAMAFAYNGRLRPAEILWDGESDRPIARAESVDDFLGRYET